MRYRVLTLVLSAIIVPVVLAFFLTRPPTTVSALQEAVFANDAKGLEELVAQRELHSSFRLHFARATPSAPNEWTPNRSGELGAIFGNTWANTASYSASSAEGLKLLLSGGTMHELTRLAAGLPFTTNTRNDEVIYESKWRSPSEYWLLVLRSGALSSKFILRREGLWNWKLAGVEIAGV